jgi:hypothetical protein
MSRCALIRATHASDYRDAIDFDVEWAPPRRNIKEDARRRIDREIARVNLVEGREVRLLGRAVDVARERDTRAVSITPAGAVGFQASFELSFDRDERRRDKISA